MKASERHKLKEDVFTRAVVTAIGWTRRYRQPIFIGVAAAAVAAGVVLWVIVSRRSAENEAQMLLRETWLKARMASFQKPGERERAVREVLNRADLIASDYRFSSAAPLALLQAGRMLVEVGRPADAVRYYHRALELADRWEGIRTLARMGLASALEEAGKPREAIAQYGVLVNDPASPVAAEAAWHVGRCYEELGDPNKAIRAYRRAVEFGADSEWAALAHFRISHLKGRKGAEEETEPSS